MNPFQKQCSESIGRVLSRHDLTIEFTEHPHVPPPKDGAAMFLRGDLVHGGCHYRICVYPDGAGANIQRNWYVLERQNHPSPDALIEAFCEFFHKCLEGRHPLTALEEVRR